MQQLLYADEVRPLADVPLPDGEVREPELKLAKQLIDQIASETFDPTQYHDEVRERIQADIEKKVQGQDIAEPPRPRRARAHHRPDGGAQGEPRQEQGRRAPGRRRPSRAATPEARAAPERQAAPAEPSAPAPSAGSATESKAATARVESTTAMMAPV